jgi:hypothetical protein
MLADVDRDEMIGVGGGGDKPLTGQEDPDAPSFDFLQLTSCGSGNGSLPHREPGNFLEGKFRTVSLFRCQGRKPQFLENLQKCLRL